MKNWQEYTLQLVISAGISFALLNFVEDVEVKWALIISLGISITLVIITYVLSLYGKNKHKRIFYKERFNKLIELGFELENIHSYYGLIKTTKNGTIRIYYDWTIEPKKFLSSGAIVVVYYYEPLVYDYNDLEVKEELIKSLNKKYEHMNPFEPHINFGVDRLILHSRYYPWKRSDSIQLLIEKSIIIIEKENLTGMKLNQLAQPLKKLKEKNYFKPFIETAYAEI